ncbi:MAG: Imm10 family immunity protein [Phycisphaerales bacterium]
MVAFAERSAEAGPSLLLSRALSSSDQDRELGEDGLYVEVCDQSRGRYGSVLSVEVSQDVVRVCFDADAAKLLKVRECLEIRTAALDVGGHLLVEKLREVVGKHIEVTDLTSG